MPRKSKSISDMLAMYPELVGHPSKEVSPVEVKSITTAEAPLVKKTAYKRRNVNSEVAQNATLVQSVPTVTPIVQAKTEVAAIVNKERKPNKWLSHVQDIRKANPDKNYRECLILAKGNYTK